MRRNFEADKARVLGWFEKYCRGYKNARKKQDILPYVDLEERYFRQIVHDLKKEGHIYSTSSRGYWWALLATNNHAEIVAMKESLKEEKSRAMSLLEGIDKKMKALESHNQGQKELVL